MALFKIPLKTGQLNSSAVDGIIYVTDDITKAPESFRSTLTAAKALDSGFDAHVHVFPVDLPAKRLIFSSVSKLSDYDDVRSFADAAQAAVKRALLAGVKTPLLILSKSAVYENAQLVSLLGALEALYVPIQLREEVTPPKSKASSLYVASDDGTDVSSLLKLAEILEEGRSVARDIGGGDPERMAPPRVQEFVEVVFKNVENVKIEVISDEKTLLKEYPLFAAVNRAASVIDRHKGRIMFLRYDPEGEITQSLYLVGKGITYDTGGSDVKTDGKMIGMSRDKCGAAAVAGFMKVVSQLKPKGVRVVGALCIARNSIGENGYVADEVITARSGARVRIINTDAEGRMVMADVLCKLKEEAQNAENPHLFTIATLTGHAVLTAGPYSIVVDNSNARKARTGYNIQSEGEAIGDPFELSTLRREDFANYAGRQEGDDVDQSRGVSSARSQRGHQGPAAFLVVASGLNKHGLKSDKPLKYSHLDIAGSAGDPPQEPTGAPILALFATFLRQSVN